MDRRSAEIARISISLLLTCSNIPVRLPGPSSLLSIQIHVRVQLAGILIELTLTQLLS